MPFSWYSNCTILGCLGEKVPSHTPHGSEDNPRKFGKLNGGSLQSCSGTSSSKEKTKEADNADDRKSKVEMITRTELDYQY